MTNISSEHICCNICGSAKAENHIICDGFLVEAKFNIVRCIGCGHVFVNPCPTQSWLDEVYYTKDYYAGYFAEEKNGDSSYTDNIAGFIPRYHQAMRKLQKCRKKGKLLDIGCATGEFLKVAAQYGFDVHGIDLSEWAVSIATSEKHLPNVRVGDIKAGIYPKGQFDICTMWFNIEHLRDPFGALDKTGEIMKPGGVLYIETPNINDIRISEGKRWNNYIPPAHLHYFSPLTISALLEKAGFETISLETGYHNLLGRTFARWPLARTINRFVRLVGMILDKAQKKNFKYGRNLRVIAKNVRNV